MKLLFGRGQTTFLKNIAEAREVIADLTVALQREVALLQLADGTTVLRLGSESSFSAKDATRVLAHSHPRGHLIISDSFQGGKSDARVLADRKQVETFLVAADGALVRCTSASARWLDDVEYTIFHKGNRIKE